MSRLSCYKDIFFLSPSFLPLFSLSGVSSDGVPVATEKKKETLELALWCWDFAGVLGYTLANLIFLRIYVMPSMGTPLGYKLN